MTAQQEEILFRISPEIGNEELNALFGEAWPAHSEWDFTRTLAHSLAWVCAYRSGNEQLVGFVNLAWDGAQHAFILDTTVHPDFRRRGIGQRLVHEAVTVAWEHGLEWVHVDYEPHLHEFYDACGFRHTPAGVIDLRISRDQES